MQEKSYQNLSSQDSALAQDAEHRTRALDLASFIVEAPAGAGKTELLTQRYLKLLQFVNAPEEIIAITFTNKAASEMRVRIMDSLQMAAKGDLPSASHKQITFALGQQALVRSSELGWRLLETPARLRIYTIDSLCGNLARQMPLLSRFGTQPKVTEDASLYYREAADKVLALMDDDTLGKTVQTVLRYVDNDQAKLTDLLVDMLAKREQWLSYTQSADSATTAANALTALVEAELAQIANVLPARTQTQLMPIASYAASQLALEKPEQILLDWDTALTASIEDLPFWRGVAEVLLTQKGDLRKRLDKNMGLPATDEAKPYKEALTALIDDLAQHSDSAPLLARIRALPDPSHALEQWPIVAALTQMLNLAAAELWLTFQSHHEVDFVEISQRALAALQDPQGLSTELAMRLDYRIQHVLVDEFQDTSPVQIDLLKALTQGWQANDSRTLFAVGDPMQSIYRFRKANVGLFLRVAQDGIGDIQLTPLKLSRNNRSCPPVVDWINQTFEGIFPKEDQPNQGAISYRPFVATKTNSADAGITVHPLLTNNASDEDELPADVRQTEAERIIEIIQTTRLQHPKARIAVLVRARRHLYSLVTEMRRNHTDLSFQAVEIEELANRQIVQDLLTLTHALHQRADRVHWLALLRAPCCGLTLADLHALIGRDSHSTIISLMQNEQRLSVLSQDGQARVRHVRQVMQQALDFRGRSSISRWIHNTWLHLGGADCLWDANDVHDVQAFFARIANLEANGQFSPNQLAEDVKKLYAAPNAKADDSLQFMTIHKSKGLEFDTVILPGLDGRSRGQDKPLLLWEEVINSNGEVSLVTAPLVPKSQQVSNEASPYDYLNGLEQTRAGYEDARVLYVAATRTERHLHLLGAAKRDKNGTFVPPKNTFLAMLWPSIHHAFTEDNIIAPIAIKQQASTTISEFVPKLIRVRQAQPPAILHMLAEPSVPSQTSYAVTAETNSLKLEADIGTLTHLYLQLLAEQATVETDWHTLAKKLNISAMQRWFKQKGYDNATCQSASTDVVGMLNTTLNSLDSQWVLKPHAQAACELAIEQTQDNEIKKWVIDRTFVDKDKRWIIDYKTIAFDADADILSLKRNAEQYRAQLENYAQLFANEGLPIEKAILFVRIGKLIAL